MSAACAPAHAAPYRRRRPERTLLYRTVHAHLAPWPDLCGGDPQGGSVPAHVERE